MNSVQEGAVRKAVERCEAALQEARDEAIQTSDSDRKITLKIKDRISSTWAPYVWVLVQSISSACLLRAVSPGHIADASQVGISLAIGASFAPILSALRRARWARQPGMEDGEGALERLLVDAALGSYALPAPWEWRASEARWGASAALAESIASVNVVLFWHAGVQASVARVGTEAIGPLEGTAMGMFAVVAAAAARCTYFYDRALDGAPAELAAARRLAQRAEGYYAMTSTSDEARRAAVHATEALAEAWARKFAVGDGLVGDDLVEQLALASASAGVCALAWELSGQSAIAPIVALALCAADVYLLRPDPELTAVTVLLDDL